MAKRNDAHTSKPSIAAVSEEWSIFRKISWWSLLAMVFVTPIAMSNLTFLGFQLPLSYDQFDIIKVLLQRVLGLVALGAWVWDMMLNGGKIRRTPVEWLILAFLGWVTLSTIFSIHPPTAFFGKYRRFEGLASFLNYAIIYFLVVQFADRPSRLRALAQSLFWSGIVVAGYGVLQSLGLDFVQWGQLPFEARRSFSTFGNPDLLGGFLMFSTFISIGLALAEERTKWRAVYWAGFLLNIWCVLAAFTRSAWIGTAVGLFFIVLFAVRQKVPWKTLDWGFAGSVAAVGTAVIVRSLSNPNEVMNFGKRLASILEFDQGSALTRFQIWDAAWEAIKDRPILGFGADTFRLVFPKYKPFEYTGTAGYLSVADNVHNYPLQLAAGIGVPGMLMLYGIFGWVAARSFKLVFTREYNPNRMLLAGFWAACAAYVAHLFFGLSVTGSSFLMWTCMGALMAPTASAFEFKRPSWGVIVATVVTLLVVVGAVYQFVFFAADAAYLRARLTSVGQTRTAFAQQAVRLNPFNDIYRAEVGLAYSDELYDALGAIGQGGNSDQLLSVAQIAFENSERSLKETIAFVPWEYDNYVFLANLYNVAAQVFDPAFYDQAIEIGRQGVAVEPYGPAIRLQLARAYVGAGRLAEAEKELQYAYKLDPNYGDVIVELALTQEKLGRIEDALATLRRATSIPAVAEELKRLEASATTPPAE